MSKIEKDFELAKRKIEGITKLLQEVIDMDAKLEESDVEQMYELADHLYSLAQEATWVNSDSCEWSESSLDC